MSNNNSNTLEEEQKDGCKTNIEGDSREESDQASTEEVQQNVEEEVPISGENAQIFSNVKRTASDDIEQSAKPECEQALVDVKEQNLGLTVESTSLKTEAENVAESEQILGEEKPNAIKHLIGSVEPNIAKTTEGTDVDNLNQIEKTSGVGDRDLGEEANVIEDNKVNESIDKNIEIAENEKESNETADAETKDEEETKGATSAFDLASYLSSSGVRWQKMTSNSANDIRIMKAAFLKKKLQEKKQTDAQAIAGNEESKKEDAEGVGLMGIAQGFQACQDPIEMTESVNQLQVYLSENAPSI